MCIYKDYYPILNAHMLYAQLEEPKNDAKLAIQSKQPSTFFAAIRLSFEGARPT